MFRARVYRIHLHFESSWSFEFAKLLEDKQNWGPALIKRIEVATSDRIAASLMGIGVGDALGKQSDALSHEEVRSWFPSGIRGFEQPAGEVIDRFRSHRYLWRVGEWTDDTEQTLAVAKAIIEEGTVSHRGVARKLMECTKSVHAPCAVWQLTESADIDRVCFSGDGCGAAMRAAPIGMAIPLMRKDMIVMSAFEASIPTHGGSLAICAAASVAVATSAAIEGYDADTVFDAADWAAVEARKYRSPSEYDFAHELRSMRSNIKSLLAARQALPGDLSDLRTALIVTLAIALATTTGSAEETILLAANLGGDSDTVASIGAGIAGAISPDSIPQSWYEIVCQVNGFDVRSISGNLRELRESFIFGSR